MALLRMISSPLAQSVDLEESEAMAVFTNLNLGSCKMAPMKSAMRCPVESSDEGVLWRSSRQQLQPSLPDPTVTIQLSEQNPLEKQVNSNPHSLNTHTL